MFDALRNWMAVRAELRAERARRAMREVTDGYLIEEKLEAVFRFLHAGYREDAEAAFDALDAAYPGMMVGNPGAVHALLQLGRIDAAEELVARSQRRFPDDRRFAELYGAVGDHRSDLQERLRRWRAFRRRYPAYANSFIHEAHALEAVGDPAAAEAVLAQGVRTVPEEVRIAIEYAQRADRREDWAASLERWTAVRDLHDYHLAPVMMARALEAMGRPADAAATLVDGRQRQPTECEIVEEQARLAERQGDLAAAGGFWREVVRDFPHRAHAYVEGTRTLIAAGDVPGAEALLAAAIGRTPGDQGLLAQYADLATTRAEWEAAALRWGAVRAVAPDDSLAIVREAQALHLLGRTDEAQALVADAAARMPDDAMIAQAVSVLAAARAAG
ncbi:tetratricopeptide repeat protein [Acidisphaera rubrifaciens]|uniref:Tetratricopeptide repeat family protein n=1 Tax=Acidisphaera rubrifaciens HS-AP3 TaxID=1231350 RepID=A0A0D6P5J5_9PROT|nr:hypothetical protein [Acidisphaera rubrifaciens]GAN76134.1 tetratricopeptide repeat family protein [Acidisphaera rubrifaciens HS-AP3]